MDNTNFSSLSLCHKVLDQTISLLKYRFVLQDTITNWIFLCISLSDISKANMPTSFSYNKS